MNAGTGGDRRAATPAGLTAVSLHQMACQADETRVVYRFEDGGTGQTERRQAMVNAGIDGQNVHQTNRPVPPHSFVTVFSYKFGHVRHALRGVVLFQQVCPAG